jgi:hypothetical protein
MKPVILPKELRSADQENILLLQLKNKKIIMNTSFEHIQSIYWVLPSCVMMIVTIVIMTLVLLVKE